MLLLIILWIFSFKSTLAADYVTVSGSKLMLDQKEYFVKGVNVGFGRYFKSGLRLQVFQDFRPDNIEQEIIYLKKTLGINTIRMLLPSPAEFDTQIQYRFKSDPWYQSNGQINNQYKDRLIAILNLCQKHDIKMQLNLSGPQITEADNPDETYWFNYLESLVPYLKGHPALMSYETLNESMVNWPVNGSQPSWYDAKVLNFTKKYVSKIRSLDQNHLITSSELIFPPDSQFSSYWWYPSPDFFTENGVSLYSLVDYISPHLYSHNLKSFTSNTINEALKQVSLRSNKPVILGEFGYFDLGQLDTSSTSVYRQNQKQFIDSTISSVEKNNLSGLIIWDPWPLLILEPNSYTKKLISGPYPEMEYSLNGKMSGIFRLLAIDDDQFYLFDNKLSLIPAGESFSQSFVDKVPKTSLITDINGDGFIDNLDLQLVSKDIGKDFSNQDNINTDINHDGVVDNQDIGKVSIGDQNGDFRTDLLDFSIWKDRYLLGLDNLVHFSVWKDGYLKSK